MAEFDYRAAARNGSVVEGRMAAASRDEALRGLRAQGLTPLRLAAASGAAAPAAVRVSPAEGGRRRLFARGNRLPGFQDIHDLTNELAVMIRAGLPLDRALRVLISMSAKPSMKQILEALLKAVKGGTALSQAMLPYEKLFGTFYISMVRSGEVGGHLDDALTQMAEHLERTRALRDNVISATLYPLILLVVAVVSVFLLLGFVVPKFESMFEDLGDALPLLTRIVLAASNIVAGWWWLILLSGVVVGGLLRRWLRSDAGQAWKDEHVLRLPLLGQLARKYEITRFARSMGTLLHNGVPIVNAIRIASDTLGNRVLRHAVDSVAPEIKQGGRMGEALDKAGLFTPLTLNMVKLGEETGRLDDMLLEVARVHDSEVQSGIRRMLTILEPLLILSLGVMIAFIIIAILLGVMSINELAG